MRILVYSNQSELYNSGGISPKPVSVFLARSASVKSSIVFQGISGIHIAPRKSVIYRGHSDLPGRLRFLYGKSSCSLKPETDLVGILSARAEVSCRHSTSETGKHRTSWHAEDHR